MGGDSSNGMTVHYITLCYVWGNHPPSSPVRYDQQPLGPHTNHYSWGGFLLVCTLFLFRGEFPSRWYHKLQAAHYTAIYVHDCALLLNWYIHVLVAASERQSMFSIHVQLFRLFAESWSDCVSNVHSSKPYYQCLPCYKNSILIYPWSVLPLKLGKRA